MTWDQYLASGGSIVFQHVTGNDPRPHYAHQSNLADWNPVLPETDTNQGGILYPYLDNILGFYHNLYADNAPIVQLTSSDQHDAPARRPTPPTWRRARCSLHPGQRAAHRLDRATDVPVTGALTGEAYAGRLSQWLTVPAGETVIPLAAPVVTPVGLTGTTPVTGPGSTPATTTKTTITRRRSRASRAHARR